MSTNLFNIVINVDVQLFEVEIHLIKTNSRPYVCVFICMNLALQQHNSLVASGPEPKELYGNLTIRSPWMWTCLKMYFDYIGSFIAYFSYKLRTILHLWMCFSLFCRIDSIFVLWWKHGTASSSLEQNCISGLTVTCIKLLLTYLPRRYHGSFKISWSPWNELECTCLRCFFLATHVLVIIS